MSIYLLNCRICIYPLFDALWHIISDVSWVHEEFQVNTTPSNSYWSNSILYSVASSHPRLSSFDPQPPQNDFYCLHDWLNNSLLTDPANAQHVVNPAEKLGVKPLLTISSISSVYLPLYLHNTVLLMNYEFWWSAGRLLRTLPYLVLVMI